MLSPFDDYPIHPSADPIASPRPAIQITTTGTGSTATSATGPSISVQPWVIIPFAASSTRPSAWSRDGVEHSIFASGVMPLDRSTTIGPIRVEVLEPMRTIRYVVEPNEHGIDCDLTFRATTVAIEEPRRNAAA